MTTATNNFTQFVYNLLKSNGFPVASLPFVVSQVMHETGGKFSNVAKLNNNLSGIKFLNVHFQKNASQGSKSPEGNYYAKFATLDDWARDYKRILSLNRGAGKPIDSTTIEEFSKRLIENHYYTAAPKDYSSSLAYWLEKIKQFLANNAAKTVVLLIIAFALINS